MSTNKKVEKCNNFIESFVHCERKTSILPCEEFIQLYYNNRCRNVIKGNPYEFLYPKDKREDKK